MTFEVEHVSYRYAGASRRALDDVNLDVGDGTFYGVIGPNGSGKSTLLRVLLGLLAPEAGDVRLDGRPVHRWTRRDLARRVGVVTQDEEMIFPVDVRSLVSMGRYPHLAPFQPLRRADHQAIERAMERCEVTEFGSRLVSTLSGGERQRARLARALAQEPVSYALDEPTAALDIAHEMTMFELLARLVREDHATVLVVTHNLNLAARYADRLLLLDRGRVSAEGSPAEVLTRERIESIWGWPVHIAAHPGPGRDSGAPQVVPLAAGNESTVDHTRAKREGNLHA